MNLFLNILFFIIPILITAEELQSSTVITIFQEEVSFLDGDVAGLVPGVGEAADGFNALIYLARGDRMNAALSGAAMIPFAGWAATGAKVGMKAVKGVKGGGVQYTKSSLQMGRKMHDAYKLSEHAPELGRFKEFRKVSGVRPDFVDFNTKTIYELKPFNPRGIQQGWDQLYRYQNAFQQKYGGTWKIILEFY